MKAQRKLKAVEAPAAPLRLDLGCGKSKIDGFEGVDAIDFGQKHVLDLRKPWPWKDGSVEQAHCSHFVEHLEPMERVHFVNELYRVLKSGGTCRIVVPHWCSQRAYGDLTHKWPPVSEMWFCYLNKQWRDNEAPHNDFYKCDFDITPAVAFHPALAARNDEYRMNAITWWKEACTDTICTLTKRA